MKLHKYKFIYLLFVLLLSITSTSLVIYNSYEDLSIRSNFQLSSGDTLNKLPKPIQVMSTGYNVFICYAVVIDGERKITSIRGWDICQLKKGDIISGGALNLEHQLKQLSCSENCKTRCNSLCDGKCKLEGKVFGNS